MAIEKKPLQLLAPLFLVGMMGSGKSLMGRLLAEAMAVDFFDSDEVIVKEEGKPITAIFADPDQGEAYFRQREAAVIKKIIDQAGGGGVIVAGGGGSFINPAVRGFLQENHITSLYLDAPFWLLWRRVRSGSARGKRPLLQGTNPKRTLKDIYRARRAIYQQATLVVRVGHGFGKAASKRKNLRRLLSALQKHGMVRPIA